MKRSILSVVGMVVIAVTLLLAQGRQQKTVVITVQGDPGAANIPNEAGGATTSFALKFAGSPASSSVVIKGCKQPSSLCSTLDTYTGNADSIEKPTVDTAYDYFTVSATWSGGSGVSITVGATIIARNGSGNATITGAVASVNGDVGVVVLGAADVGAAPISHTHAESDVTNLTSDLAGKAPTSHTHTEANVTGLVSDLAGKAPTSHTHVEADVSNLVTDLAGKASTSHTHTEGQITNLTTDLAGKAPTVHTHVESDTTNLVSDLAGKAATSHTHTESQVTGLVTDLAGKSATGHTHVEADVTNLVADLAALQPSSAKTAAVTPSLLNLGTWTNGTVVTPENVTINNTSGNILNVTGISQTAFTGHGNTDFALTNSSACILKLQPFTHCSWQLGFTPSSAGGSTATYTVVSDAPIDPQQPLTVLVQGTGTASTTFNVDLGLLGAGSGLYSDGGDLLCSYNNGVKVGKCSNSYVTGTPVSISFTPDPTSVFGGFVGAGCGATSPCAFTVTHDQTITATVNLLPILVTVNLVGQGQGTSTVSSTVVDAVDGNPFSCTSTAGVLSGKCTMKLAKNTVLALTDTVAGSSVFSTWGGVNSCTTLNTCTPPTDSNSTLTFNTAPPAAGNPLALIQTIPGGTGGTNKVSGPFSAAQSAGNTNIVFVLWNDASTISSVVDTKGNTYTQSTCSPKTIGSTGGIALYYSSNIVSAAAGANTVTANFSGTPSYRALFAHEYSGLLTSGATDGCSGGTGTSTTSASGSITTTSDKDLLISGTNFATSVSTTSSGFTQQIHSSGNDTEDRQGVAVGTYSNSEVQTSSGNWEVILAAFKTSGVVASQATVTVVCGQSSGNGRVTASGIDLTCNGGTPGGALDPSTSVPIGSTLNFNAVPAVGSMFRQYAGAGCGTIPNCGSLAITQNTVVTVTFDASGAQQYYVNNSDTTGGWSVGSDTNDGRSITTPFRHITKALASFVLGPDGAQINVHKGTYSDENVSCNPGYSAAMCIPRGGNSLTQMLKIVCDTQWSVPASSGCLLRDASGDTGVVVYTNFVQVGDLNHFGFDFTNTARAYGIVVPCGGLDHISTGTCTTGSGVNLWGNSLHDLSTVGTGVCESNPNGHMGILINNNHGGRMDNVSIVGNRESDIGIQAQSTLNGGAGCINYYGMYISTSGVRVQDNQLINITGYGIHYYSGPCNGVMSGNTFERTELNNVIYGGGDCGNGVPLGGLSLTNNIFGATGGPSTACPNSCPNVQIGVPGGGAACSTSNPNFISHNIFNGASPQIAYSTGSQACTNVDTSFSEAPTATFTSYTGSNNELFILKSTSVAVDGGTTKCSQFGLLNCAPSFDTSNVQRPQRNAYDIGSTELP